MTDYHEFQFPGAAGLRTLVFTLALRASAGGSFSIHGSPSFTCTQGGIHTDLEDFFFFLHLTLAILLFPATPPHRSLLCPNEFFLLLLLTHTAYILATSSCLIFTSILPHPHSYEQLDIRKEILVTLTVPGTGGHSVQAHQFESIFKSVQRAC